MAHFGPPIKSLATQIGHNHMIVGLSSGLKFFDVNRQALSDEPSNVISHDQKFSPQ